MLKLEDFTEADFSRFMSWVKDEYFLKQFAGPVFSFPVTPEQLKNYVANKNRKVFKVIAIENKEVIGHCEINNINLLNRSARLCRILVASNSNRNKGFGKQIIKALLEIGFKELNLHRIDLGVLESNQQAINCYRKCGFKIEGLLRESFLIGNKFYSVYNMSILKKEWENKMQD